MNPEQEAALFDIQKRLSRIELRIEKIDDILHGGDSGEFGVLQKANIMWRTHIVWPLCTLSAIFGAGLTVMIQRFH